MKEPKLTETTCIDVEQVHLVRTMWDDGKQFTYKYDDSRLNIWWPIDNPILSQRDG